MTINWRGRRVFFIPIELIGLLLLSIGAIAYHHYFDAAGKGFDRSGATLLLYHLARVGLTAYLMLVSCGLGYWLLYGLVRPMPLQGIKAFIPCFFFGASVYGFGFSLLGLISVLSFNVALAGTLPIVLILEAPLRAMWQPHAVAAVFRLPRPDDKTEAVTRLGLLGVLSLALLAFILTRVVFIANPDGNVWEHYLHYFRSVHETGTTLPGEVWHHFYNSKGGGFFFLGVFLGDLFAVQLVSTCFVVASGVIIFDLLQDICADTKWALLGTCFYFSFFLGDVSDGGMFRVHAVILGYAAFFFWAWEQLATSTLATRRALLISLFAALAYMGFYQPVASVVFAPTFVMLWAARRLTGGGGDFWLAIVCGVIVAAGTAVTIGINWVLTGIPEITPMKVLWAIAQQQKVAKVFGTGGIDFFLAVNNDVSGTSPLLQRVYGNIRYLPTKAFTYLTFVVSALLIVLAIAQVSAGRQLDRAEHFVFSAIAFLLPFILLNVVFPSPSLFRMGLYTNIFVILVTIVVWQKAIGLLPADWLMNPLGLSSASTNKPLTVSIKDASACAFIITAAVGMFVQGMKGTTQYQSPIYRFARAELSLMGTMERMEEVNSRLVSGTTVDAVSEFRAQTGYTGRILGLVYDASYAYLLPGAGVVSEPTYAIVRDPANLLSLEPEAVADYLRDKKIEYVSLNLSSRLFTTFAFTSLFQPDRLRNHFDLAYEHGGFLVLRLRKKGEKQNLTPEHQIPDHALSILEMKREGVLHFPFTAEFYGPLSQPNNAVVTSDYRFQQVRDDFAREMEGLIVTRMVDRVALPNSKDLLRKLMEAAAASLRSADPGLVLGAPRAFDGELIVRVPEATARARMVRYVTNEIRKEYIVRFGEALAGLSEGCDERVPFGPVRPVSATCQ